MSSETARPSIASFWHDLPREGRLLLSVVAFEFLGTGLVLPFLVVYLHEIRGFALSDVGLLIGLGVRRLVARIPEPDRGRCPQRAAATVLRGQLHAAQPRHRDRRDPRWPVRRRRAAGHLPGGLTRRC